MVAKDGVKYAYILNNQVFEIFKGNELKEWNENDVEIVEIPQELEDIVEVGTEYKDKTFIEKKIMRIEPCEVYAFLDSNDCISSLFTENSAKSIVDRGNVVAVPKEQVAEVQAGDKYDRANGRFEVDIEYARRLYMDLANKGFEDIINIVTGEDTPLTERVSWETQERG